MRSTSSPRPASESRTMGSGVAGAGVTGSGVAGAGVIGSGEGVGGAVGEGVAVGIGGVGNEGDAVGGSDCSGDVVTIELVAVELGACATCVGVGLAVGWRGRFRAPIT